MSAKTRTGQKAERTDRLKVDYWSVDRLIPYARNARTHSEAQIAEIAGSIRAFAFSNPILVGVEGDVVAGHGRPAAARQLGLAEVPVIVLEGLSETQRRQLVLADNRIALNAGWDLEMLRLELRDLADLGADLSTLGFTAQELAKALTPAVQGLTDEDLKRDEFRLNRFGIERSRCAAVLGSRGGCSCLRGLWVSKPNPSDRRFSDGHDEPSAPPHDRGHDGPQSIASDTAIVSECGFEVQPAFWPLPGSARAR
jgi:hypothetical protein